MVGLALQGEIKNHPKVVKFDELFDSMTQIIDSVTLKQIEFLKRNIVLF